MDERDVVAAVTGVDGRDGAVGDRLSRPLDRTAARIAPAVRARVAEEQVGRRVAERGAQRIAHVHAIIAGAQGGAHATQRPGQQHPPPDQAEEERRADGDDAQRPHRRQRDHQVGRRAELARRDVRPLEHGEQRPGDERRTDRAPQQRRGRTPAAEHRIDQAEPQQLDQPFAHQDDLRQDLRLRVEDEQGVLPGNPSSRSTTASSVGTPARTARCRRTETARRRRSRPGPRDRVPSRSGRAGRPAAATRRTAISATWSDGRSCAARRPTTWSARSATTRTRCPRARRRTTCWPAPAARKARQRSARRRSAAAAARARTPHRSGRSPPPSRPKRHRPARPPARRALQAHPGPAGLGRPVPPVHSWSPIATPRGLRPDLSSEDDTARAGRSNSPGTTTRCARPSSAALRDPRRGSHLASRPLCAATGHVGFHGARSSPSR